MTKTNDTPDVITEAEWCAKEYQKRNPIERLDFLKEVMRVGGSWDMITRSLIFYPTFEKKVGMKFNCFWG